LRNEPTVMPNSRANSEMVRKGVINRNFPQNGW
jgi:hypothetical protein